MTNGKACGKLFSLCEIMGKWRVKNDPLHYPVALETGVSSFYNHANFSGVTEPQSTFIRLTNGLLEALLKCGRD